MSRVDMSVWVSKCACGVLLPVPLKPNTHREQLCKFGPQRHARQQVWLSRHPLLPGRVLRRQLLQGAEGCVKLGASDGQQQRLWGVCVCVAWREAGRGCDSVRSLQTG
jgi:hypothetical protein